MRADPKRWIRMWEALMTAAAHRARLGRTWEELELKLITNY